MSKSDEQKWDNIEQLAREYPARVRATGYSPTSTDIELLSGVVLGLLLSARQSGGEIDRLRGLLVEACELIDELTEDTPERAHAVRGREIRKEPGL